MKAKFLICFSISMVVLILSFFPSPSLSKTFDWVDYRKPFSQSIRIGTSGISNAEINLNLPESFFNKYDEFPIIISHGGLDPRAGNHTFVVLRVNGQSMWKAHKFGERYQDNDIKVVLTAEELRPGINILKFSMMYTLHSSITTGWILRKIRFDFPENLAAKSPDIKDTISEKNRHDSNSESNSKHAQKKEPTPVPETKTSSKIEAEVEVATTRWALVVGVSEYRDTRIPSLRYAENDAKAFYDWLVSPSGGRYAPARVRLLTNQEATAKSIKNSLFVWLGQAIEEDIVTLYFACHGSPQSPETPENLYLLPYDTQYDDIASTGFPMWDIETALQRFIKSKRVIVITDACHAGGVGREFDVARRDHRGLKVVPISSSLHNLSHIGDGICILTASDDDQFSQESKKWGGGHGVFTYFLLNGLKGKADYNKDSRVSLGEIIPYLSEQVRRATRNAQTPTVAGRFDPALSIGK